MTARIRVDGTWIDTQVTVDNIERTTSWTTDSASGDKRATVALHCPRTWEGACVHPGKALEVISTTGLLLWGGLTVEPDRTDTGITLVAKGIGETLSDYESMVDVSTSGPPKWVPTSTPNEAVDGAIARGARFRRSGSLGNTSLALEDDDGVQTVLTILSRAAISQGKRVHVDSTGLITYREDPTEPAWALTPGHGHMGTADETYLTTIYGRYLTPHPTSPETEAPVAAYVRAHDGQAATKFGGARERDVNLASLGVIDETVAQNYVNGRLKLVGGRMGWTETVPLSTINVRHISGATSSPQWVRAGDMLRVPGVTDARSQPTTRASIDVVLSEVTIADSGRPTGTAAPMGFAPRDLDALLAPPENTATSVVA